MKAYFIFKELSEYEIDMIKKDIQDSLVFSISGPNENILRDNFIKFQDLRTYQQEINSKGNYHIITIKVLEKWSNLEIRNQRLADFLSIDGVSLFDINFRLLANGFLQWTLMGIDLFTQIFTENAVDQIVIIGKDATFDACIRIVAKQLKIKLKEPPEPKRLKRKVTEQISLYYQLFGRLFKLSVKTIFVKLFSWGLTGYSSKKRKILAFVISDRHSKNLSSLFKFLINSKKYNFLVVNDLYAEKLTSLAREGIPYRDLIRYSNWDDYLRIRDFYFDVTKKLNRIFLGESDYINFIYKDFSLNQLVKEFFFKEFYQALLVTIEKIVIFKSLLEKEQPDLILNCNDTKYIAKLARQNGIKCISLLASTVVDLIDDGFVVSDKLLVGSYAQKESLSRICDISNIEVVGEPRFSNIDLDNISKKAKNYKLSKGIYDEIKTIVFASTYSFENDKFYFGKNELQKIFNYVYKAVSKLNGIILVTKMHPYEKDSFIHNSLASQFSLKRFILEKDIDIFQLLSIADVVIDAGSTIGLDAIFFGKPLVTIVPGPHVWSDIYSLQRHGLSRLVLDEGELYSALKEGLYNEDKRADFFLKRQQYLKGNLFDGRANQRISSILDSFIATEGKKDIHNYA